MLAVSGRLTEDVRAEHVSAIPPAALEGNSDPDKIWKASDEEEASRRTIYAFVKRSMVVPMLEVLDFCDTTRTRRQAAEYQRRTQALTLFNGDFVNRQARHLAERLRKEAGEDPARQIDLAYRLALAASAAKADEIAAMLEFLKTSSRLEQMCRVMFNLNEFVYADYGRLSRSANSLASRRRLRRAGPDRSARARCPGGLDQPARGRSRRISRPRPSTASSCS